MQVATPKERDLSLTIKYGVKFVILILCILMPLRRPFLERIKDMLERGLRKEQAGFRP